MDLNKIGQYNKQEREMMNNSEAEVKAAIQVLKLEVDAMEEEYEEEGMTSQVESIYSLLRKIERFQAMHIAAIRMHVDRVNGEDEEDGK